MFEIGDYCFFDSHNLGYPSGYAQEVDTEEGQVKFNGEWYPVDDCWKTTPPMEEG